MVIAITGLNAANAETIRIGSSGVNPGITYYAQEADKSDRYDKQINTLTKQVKILRRKSRSHRNTSHRALKYALKQDRVYNDMMDQQALVGGLIAGFQTYQPWDYRDVAVERVQVMQQGDY